MSEIDKLQHDINNLAYWTFKNGCKDCSEQYLKKFSIPLIPRITQEYLAYRLVILGQETSTWYPRSWHENEDKNHPLHESYKAFNLRDFINAKESDAEQICQVCRYDRHVQYVYGKGKRTQGLWGFSKKVCKENLGFCIKPNASIPFCLLDLFCTETVAFNGEKGKPSQNEKLADEVIKMQSNLLYRILTLIKPKAILATTNYKNDDILKQYALGDPNAKIVPIDNSGAFSPEEIASIDIAQGELIDTKVIRTYHPNFFYGSCSPQRIRKMMDKERRKRYQELIYKCLGECLWENWPSAGSRP